MNLKQYFPIRSNFDVKSLTESLSGNLGPMSSTPIANLRSAMCKVDNYYGNKQAQYDALALGFSEIDEQYDAAAEGALINGDETVMTTNEIEVSAESAEHFMQGVTEAAAIAMKDKYINDGYSNDEAVSLTEESVELDVGFSDNDGVSYDVSVFPQEAENLLNHVDDTTTKVLACYNTPGEQIPLLRTEAGKYYMNVKAYPQNYAGQVTGQGLTLSDLVSNIGELAMSERGLVPSPSWYNSDIYYRISDAALRLVPSYSGTTIVDAITTIASYFQVNISELSIHSSLVEIYQRMRIVYNKLTAHSYSFLKTAKALVTSSSINDMIRQLCQAALDSKPGQALQSLLSKTQDKMRVLRAMVNNAIDAYRVGGIRGLVKYIINYVRGGSTLANDDGTLSFTNNASYIPAQFIGGLLGAIFNGIGQMVQLVASVAKSVLLIVLSIVVSITQSIFNSLKGTHNDTYASVNIESEENAFSIIPYWPIAFFKIRVSTESSTLFKLLKAAYDSHSTVFEFQVPGGCLICGPTQVDQDTNVPTEFGCEFHPAAVAFRDGYNHDHLVPIPTICETILADSYDTTNGKYNMDVITGLGQEKFFTTLWSRLTDVSSGYLVPLTNDPSTQHLSAGATGDDSRARQTFSFSLSIFVHYLCELSNIYYSYTNVQKCATFEDTGSSPLESSDMARKYDYIVASGMHAFRNYSSSVTPRASFPAMTWTELVSLANFTQQDNCHLIRLGQSVATPTADLSNTILINPDWSDAYNVLDLLSSDNAFSPSMVLPNSLKYALNLPMYDGSTYWSWVILVGSVIAVTTAVAVVATVAFTKFAKRKRVNNLATYNDKRDTCMELMQGRESYIDDDGLMKYREFDPNSAEGKAKIDAAYKDYRKTARKCNMWANIIGGSKYDTTTFYGDAAESDTTESSSATNVVDSFNALYATEDLEEVSSEQPFTIVDTATYNYVKANSDPLITNAQLKDAILAAINSGGENVIDKIYLIITGNHLSNPEI